jgi:DNA-binding beta-propeller fold protein YncE
MLYAGYSDSLRMFNPIQLSYALHGNTAAMECDTIVIHDGETGEITIGFDDTYLYPMDAFFHGGKLNVVNTVSLPYQPKSIATDQAQNIYIISNSNEVFRYNKNIEQQGFLQDGNDNQIFASKLKFAPDSSFYILQGTAIMHYSKTHDYLESVVVESSLADLAVDSDGNVFYASNTEVIRFNAGLTSQTATLTLATIKSDYPEIDVECEIRSIAVNGAGKIAIGIDAEPDSDGKDVVLFYNNDLSLFDRAIWEEWLFNNPRNIDFDSQGNALVLSYYHDILLVFDSTGTRYQASYWSDYPGTLNGAMNGPVDLARVGNLIYVAENQNNRVTIFGLNGVIDNNLTVADTTINGSETGCFNAIDTLTLAGGAETVVFESGSLVDLIAGHTIRLLPGFWAQNESYLHATITTDNSFCFPAEQSVVYKQPEEKSVEASAFIATNQNLKTGKLVKVYPNPTSGEFTVELTHFEGTTTLTLINSLGAKAFETIVNSSEKAKVELPAINKGLYILQVRNGKTSSMAKIIIR